MMIERALLLKKALHNLTSSEKDLLKYVLSDDEWFCISEIQKLMIYFKKALDFITEQLYPTLGYNVSVYNYLLNMLKEVIGNRNMLDEIKNAAKKAKLKILEYYSTINGKVYTITTVMDSQLKFQYYMDNEWVTEYIIQAKVVITEVWNNTYKNNITDSNEHSSDNLEDDLLSHVFKKRRTEYNDELTAYLKEPIVPRKTDVLLWWKVILL